MNSGQSLEELTCLQVVQVMRRMSGLDLDTIAAAMDRNRQTVGCWFGEAAADKFIPLPLVPRFCHALGSTLLLEWLVAQYERLLRDEPPHVWSADAARTLDLLVRGLIQTGNALELLHAMGRELSPTQGRQVSEATLLAVATLAAAAREARGTFPGAPKQLRFFRDAGDRTASAPACGSRWQRLGAWLATWRGRVWRRDRHARSPEALCDELAKCREDLARKDRELVRVKRIMGAMGYLLREGGGPGNGRSATARRLLEEGAAVGGAGGCDA